MIYIGRKDGIKIVKKKKSKKGLKQFGDRFLHYTETVFYWLIRCYFIWQFISLALIIAAIYKTNQFSYLDTFITETNETFRKIAGTIIVKFLIENVFKFNTFNLTGKGLDITHTTGTQDPTVKSDAELLEEENGEDQLESEADES